MRIQSHTLQGNGPVTFFQMLEFIHTSPTPQHCRVERGPLWENAGLLATTRLVCRTVESSCLEESRSSVSSKL
jgi:hypothetical protein